MALLAKSRTTNRGITPAFAPAAEKLSGNHPAPFHPQDLWRPGSSTDRQEDGPSSVEETVAMKILSLMPVICYHCSSCNRLQNMDNCLFYSTLKIVLNCTANVFARGNFCAAFQLLLLCGSTLFNPSKRREAFLGCFDPAAWWQETSQLVSLIFHPCPFCLPDSQSPACSYSSVVSVVLCQLCSSNPGYHFRLP